MLVLLLCVCLSVAGRWGGEERMRGEGQTGAVKRGGEGGGGAPLGEVCRHTNAPALPFLTPVPTPFCHVPSSTLILPVTYPRPSDSRIPPTLRPAWFLP